MIFPCERCGKCCRHLERIPQLKEFDLGNGTCVHLQKNNLCAIYEKRPDICNVEKMYKLLYSDCMSEEEYIKHNIEGCKVVQSL